MSSVEISIEFIREVTLCGHFCWLSARVKIPVLWSNLFFHGVEGWACGLGGSLKLVSEYGGSKLFGNEHQRSEYFEMRIFFLMNENVFNTQIPKF